MKRTDHKNTGGQVNLWCTREKALASLRDSLLPEAMILLDTFKLVDECSRKLEALNSEFGRICALTLIKARNLALGCYSLSLDGLAQEAGALFRPLIEAFELLIYFRHNPAGIKEAIDDMLPTPGKRAQKIKGQHQELREHLNKHASHLSVSNESMRHLIDFNQGALKLSQPHNDEVLRKNLHSLLAIILLVADEAIECVSVGSSKVDMDLVYHTNQIHGKYNELVNFLPHSEKVKNVHMGGKHEQ